MVYWLEELQREREREREIQVISNCSVSAHSGRDQQIDLRLDVQPGAKMA